MIIVIYYFLKLSHLLKNLKKTEKNGKKYNMQISLKKIKISIINMKKKKQRQDLYLILNILLK